MATRLDREGAEASQGRWDWLCDVVVGTCEAMTWARMDGPAAVFLSDVYTEILRARVRA